MRHYVYIHTSPEGVVFYIGKGKKPLNNFAYKRAYSFAGTHRSEFWQHYVNKYGLPVVTIDSEFETAQEAYAREIELIAIHGRRKDGGTLVNHSLGGGGTKGPLSLEHRRKISESRKGCIVSDITRAKIGAAHLGMKHSDEARAKMSKAHSGVPRPWRKGMKYKTKSKADHSTDGRTEH